MKTFLARQQLRKAKRKLHQKRTVSLFHKLGGLASLDWANHKYSIERRVRGLGKIAVNKETQKRKRAFLAGIGQ